jgi:outer membrane protein assembly factor BamE (lipoprotein component of BamABCDE complex)
MSFYSADLRLGRVVILFFVLIAVIIGGLVSYETATRPIYYRLRPGMAMEEVRSIMGAPSAAYGDARCADWYYAFERSRGRSSLCLVFREGRLVDTGEKEPFWGPD